MEAVRAELQAAKASRKAGTAAAKGFAAAAAANTAAVAPAAPAKRGRKRTGAKSPEQEPVSTASNQQQ
jgi:hypothetical protein